MTDVQITDRKVGKPYGLRPEGTEDANRRPCATKKFGHSGSHADRTGKNRHRDFGVVLNHWFEPELETKGLGIHLFIMFGPFARR